MEISTSVQTLINTFELMTQANAVSASVSRSRSASGFKKTLPNADNTPVTTFVERMKTQHSCIQSKVTELNQKAEKAVEPQKELEKETEEDSAATSIKSAAYKGLTINTSNKYDTTVRDSCNSTFYSMASHTPSAYSTASTCSLDSLLSSSDLLPEELQVSSMTRPEIVVKRSRPTLDEHSQQQTASKLTAPTCSVLIRKPLSTKKKESSNLGSKSTCRSSKSTRNVMVPSPLARTLSTSSSSPRYMDYDSSPRYAATKAWNMERRRQLEERNRSFAANKANKHPSSKTAHVGAAGTVAIVKCQGHDPGRKRPKSAAA
ncbi:unnamed protein product [Peronospora belbahrii]|uniref:Uncharacterized protein n=1 Tax=Peronospora belbahrii TaxID=622444 RepID=A0ABN8CXQ8_9STRA|nr:unnamed protein product [Peronospora belbahrii]